MNPYKAYQAQQEATAPRIEVLLQVYDRLRELLQQAHGHLAREDRAAAQPVLLRLRVAVAALAVGVDVSHGDLPENLVRLYQFVVHRLEAGQAQDVREALRVITTLHEGLEGIRGEALALERAGQIPALDREHTFQATG